MSDELFDGRRIRLLTIVDNFTRESLAVKVAACIGGPDVVEILHQLMQQHRLPGTIRVDHGPEFTSKRLDEWAYRRGVKLNFVRPGKPAESAFAESFNGRLRDECLNINCFMSVRHAREIMESWRQDYNDVRPHSSLKGRSPKEYAEAVAALYFPLILITG